MKHDIVLASLSCKRLDYLAKRLDLLSAMMLQLPFLFSLPLYLPLCLFHLHLSNLYYVGTLLRITAILKALTVGGIIYGPLWF